MQYATNVECWLKQHIHDEEDWDVKRKKLQADFVTFGFDILGK